MLDVQENLFYLNTDVSEYIVKYLYLCCPIIDATFTSEFHRLNVITILGKT